MDDVLNNVYVTMKTAKKNICRFYSQITGNQLPVHFPLFLLFHWLSSPDNQGLIGAHMSLGTFPNKVKSRSLRVKKIV